MPKLISASDLRTQIKRVINEVGYGQSEYVVEKFGEPVAAVISMQDFRLLQEIKQKQAAETGGSDFKTKLLLIREELQTGGYQPRTRAEVDAQLEADRDSWTQ